MYRATIGSTSSRSMMHLPFMVLLLSFWVWAHYCLQRYYYQYAAFAFDTTENTGVHSTQVVQLVADVVGQQKLCCGLK